MRQPITKEEETCLTDPVTCLTDLQSGWVRLPWMRRLSQIQTMKSKSKLSVITKVNPRPPQLKRKKNWSLSSTDFWSKSGSDEGFVRWVFFWNLLVSYPSISRPEKLAGDSPLLRPPPHCSPLVCHRRWRWSVSLGISFLGLISRRPRPWNGRFHREGLRKRMGFVCFSGLISLCFSLTDLWLQRYILFCVGRNKDLDTMTKEREIEKCRENENDWNPER